MRIAEIRVWALRAPIAVPVRTSFGTMRDRPMVAVRVADSDGATGWGEVWCNFPTVGAEHRARLVESAVGPLLLGRDAADPAARFAELTKALHVLALQTGEAGPLAHVVAGLDIALWDLAARRAGTPLWRLLGGASPRIAAYASGLNPDAPETLALARRAEGHRAFKLKVGFGVERDRRNLAALRDALGPEARLMADANQAWDLPTARAMAGRFAPFGLDWLEEPVPADTPWTVWQSLAADCGVPLAAGENLAGAEAFDAALASRALAIVQPDACKWGGISGTLPVARAIRAAGARYCPHYLGGGIGLLASAHLLAAAGGDGLLEIDANPNPLRETMAGALARIEAGHTTLAETPGLGVEPDPAAFARHCTYEAALRA